MIFGFIRVGTNARAFQNPMTSSEAAGRVRDWLKQPAVHVLGTDAAHVENVLKLLEKLGTAGNLVTDAQIAAIAIDHKAVLHTSDADFIRFAGLRWFNPITSAGSHALQKPRA